MFLYFKPRILSEDFRLFDDKIVNSYSDKVNKNYVIFTKPFCVQS